MKTRLFFAVGFIQRINDCMKTSDFSPEYEQVGLKSYSVWNSKIRPINGTAKDKNNIFAQLSKHEAIDNKHFKSTE